MRIQTIHPAVNVAGTLVTFTKQPSGQYEADLDDVVGQQLLDAAKNDDYRRLDESGTPILAERAPDPHAPPPAHAVAQAEAYHRATVDAARIRARAAAVDIDRKPAASGGRGGGRK